MIRVIEDPDGQNLNTDYVFDTLGNLRKTIQGEQSRYFNYDSLGRLLYAKQPEQEANTAFAATDAITSNTNWSVKYVYDDNGNITQTTDARNISVTGTYDKFNRLINRDYSDATPDVSFFYDGTGLGAVPAFSKGKTTKVSSSISETRYTSFDNLGRLLTSQQMTDGQTYNSGYQYNLSGQLTQQTYPSGRVVINEFDADGALSRVAGNAAGQTEKTYANSFSYNAAGAVTSLKLGNGKWESAKYNNRLQVEEMGLGNSATDTSLLKLSFGYGTNQENNGSMRSQTIVVPTVGASQGFTATQTYAYDNLNRLQSATETIGGSQTWKQTFSFDRFGNRRFDSNNTTTLGSCSQSECNPLINTSDNRISNGQGYAYDKDGNVTLDAENQRFIYDAESKQTQFFKGTNNTSTPDATYLYDGEGKRVKKISYLETTVFVYDGAGQLVAEYSTQISATPQTSYLTEDHLGSPRVVTNQLGVVISRKDFRAFGEETLTSQRVSGLGYDPLNAKNQPEETRQDYTGYEKDEESGLDYAQARYYNSSHGRFTSVDPLTASASIRNPQTFNRYSYVLNSPYKFTDPLGLLPVSVACAQWCPNSGPSVDGSAFRGRDASFDWAREYFGEVVGYGLNQPEATEPEMPPSADEKDKEKNSFSVNMMILNYFGINSVTESGNIVVKPVPELIKAVMDAAREIYKDAEALSNYIKANAQVMDAVKEFPGDKINPDDSKNQKMSINDRIKQMSRAIDAKIIDKVKYISSRFGGEQNTFTVRLAGTNKVERGHYYNQIDLAGAVRNVLQFSRRRSVLNNL